MNIFLKIIAGIFTVVVAIALFAFAFLIFWKPLGGSATKSQREDYAKRAPNFDGKKFHNDGDFSLMHTGGKDDLRVSKNGVRPNFSLPVGTVDFFAENSVTWFGHSSVFLRLGEKSILFDPVFSDVISPVSFVGAKRFSSPAVSISEFPKIDVLILSHDHYDHLDYKSILEIDSKVSRYVVPLGVENHLIRWGISKEKITEMAWWEETRVDDISIVCTPARHFSGRRLVDSMQTLWSSWVLDDGKNRIFECGDSGWGKHFEEIGKKYAPFDLALMECGQYDAQWPEVHMFPEQSANAARDLGAKIALPIHWGAIVLSRHGWDDSAERFVRACQKMEIPVLAPKLSQTVSIREVSKNYWWRSLKTDND